MSGQIQWPTLVESLAQRLVEPVDDAARERATWHFLDWLACAAAGSESPAGSVLKEARATGSMPDVFAWGGLGNVLEMDDVDKRALLHPGPVVLPAVLSTAIDQHSDALAILDAVVRGYEATIRLGRAVGPGHYALWHNTGTCGVIGAAAATTSLLGLSQAEFAHALSLAISQSTGFWQTRHEPESMGKQLHAAHAARAGRDAALLASMGMIGPRSILEGSQGFFAATCPGADPSGLNTDAKDWAIHDVSFKPWPACRHAHAAIDAALVLRERGDQWTNEIVVSTYADALKFCDRQHPQSVIEAKFSLQHAVAVTLLRGRPQLRDFEPEAFHDSYLRDLRERIQVAVDTEYNDAYPARFGARLATDGVTVAVSDALGDPENPLDLNGIKTKARSLFDVAGLPATARESLIDVVLNLKNTHNTDDLFVLVSEVLP